MFHQWQSSNGVRLHLCFIVLSLLLCGLPVDGQTTTPVQQQQRPRRADSGSSSSNSTAASSAAG
jgi:hypothetical protein